MLRSIRCFMAVLGLVLVGSARIADSTPAASPARVARSAQASDSAQTAPLARDSANVILVTLDGVRWEEMFEGEDDALGGISGAEVFPLLKQRLARRHGGAVLLGDRADSEVKVSNPHVISLPAYHSLMAGAVTDCDSNSCGRIKHETLPELAQKALGVPRSRVAVFGSWKPIRHSAESKKGAVTVNTGISRMKSPHTSRPDEVMRILNDAQSSNRPPWPRARFDQYTWAHAMHYLRTYQPRFMYVSLNDSDEWGHRGKYANYLKSLRTYDRWIARLLLDLEKMGAYGRDTVVIVTTDHGRGKGSKWRDHSAQSGGEDVWIYAEDLSGKGRLGELTKTPKIEHTDLRAVLETWLGVRR